MTSHDKNHAVEPDGCQVNGVQSDIELRKWAIQTILLSPHPLPSSLEKLGSASLRLASFAKHGTLFPDLYAVVDTSLFGRRIKAGNKNVSSFQCIKNFALIARKFIYFPFKFFYAWFHKESSPICCCKHRVDDGGGGSNATACREKCWRRWEDYSSELQKNAKKEFLGIDLPIDGTLF